MRSRAATTCSRSRWRWIPCPGYELASWERGYGDFALTPDLATLRRIPWLEATALVLCDVGWHDGSPVAPSPRQVLRAQVERAEALGFTPMIGSELEFYLLKETYAEAHAQQYRDLTPSVPYILDYHVLASTYDEPFIRQIRNGMQGAGIKVETSKGEAWPGQHEINFRYADALDDGRQPRRLQERGEGDRAPERLLDHLHGEAGPHAGSARPATSTRRSGVATRARSRARRPSSTAGWRGRSPA